MKDHISRCGATVRLAGIGAVLALAGSICTVAAENFFHWDAESFTTSLGTHPGFTGATSFSTTEKHGGSRSMRLDVKGDDGGNQSMGLTDTGEYRIDIYDGHTVYYRWWMKFDSEFKWGSTGTRKTKTSRIKRVGNVPPPILTGYMSHNSVSIGECNACSSGTLPPVAYDFRRMAGAGWHEYIAAIKFESGPHASDGEFHFYVDGAEIGSGVTGFSLMTEDSNPVAAECWGGWMVSPYFQMNATAADGGTIFLDDFSTDDTWNSLQWPNPGSPGDTVPTQPHSLKIAPK